MDGDVRLYDRDSIINVRKRERWWCEYKSNDNKRELISHHHFPGKNERTNVFSRTVVAKRAISSSVRGADGKPIARILEYLLVLFSFFVEEEEKRSSRASFSPQTEMFGWTSVIGSEDIFHSRQMMFILKGAAI